MPTLLKNIYSKPFYESFSETVYQTIPSFDQEKFIHLIFNDEFDTYELKDRMHHTATVMHQFLSDDFPEAMVQIKDIIKNLRQTEQKKLSLEFMFFPDYVEQYGLNHFEPSVDAMEFITQFTSCEFAVRPFILEYDQKMLDRMQAWSDHENHHVRRLASEGSRPRLPWAMALPPLKSDPAPILPILENLKEDPSEYVRRSVANNLNDISKDNPKVTKSIAVRWLDTSAETDALVKHGCRTLFKQGDMEVMNLFGFSSEKLECAEFVIHTPRVKRGDVLEFSFSVKNRDQQSRLLRLEYALYFLRKNGTHSKKVFKISEREIEPGEELSITRKQSFRPISTRKYYPGQQKVSVIMNGKESDSYSFRLI
ncbi:DNA alkylation repair protein [Rhodohalobacter sp. SW132]|uniref:DNA alkylation repair protein n=1 Tax=Rhodohalobacter sp. SW132 TaxID=2293433 RepID=UPI000E23DF1A|nr:DNA alkylation repair protein [Rhodohalobacter sp. SW132]REL33526.1 DNA alkylation repair protein [Rhodohalobacter sp. SW132]